MGSLTRFLPLVPLFALLAVLVPAAVSLGVTWPVPASTRSPDHHAVGPHPQGLEDRDPVLVVAPGLRGADPRASTAITALSSAPTAQPCPAPSGTPTTSASEGAWLRSGGGGPHLAASLMNVGAPMVRLMG
ncbi:hypothetical protein FHG66_11145 [Rubellimicrobium rubrum]|uniref:Uncharacterized protein n=1 Tax=Rubellimicrobium rubrum TaxID=2585369 RepID=A0A5C4MYB7_9RHOB|nr:hypothetical protein [Rubellimicrobium rubrum]TNC49444.1 hypothetical protein FHG66_11145 [Rubellimicrobium rubrum]